MSKTLREISEINARTKAKCESIRVQIFNIRQRDQVCKDCTWRSPDTCKSCRKEG